MKLEFNADECCKYVEMLVQHDEVERALLVLDNVPAFYRDYPKPQMIELRKRIHRSRMTPSSYATNKYDELKEMDFCVFNFKNTIRGKLIEAEIRNYNAKGLVPHLVDMGPGDFWMILAISNDKDLKCTYWPIGLQLQAKGDAIKLVESYIKERAEKSQPEIFVATEIIEHLPCIDDIASEAARHCNAYPERVFLSTPCYTFKINDEWDVPNGMGHIRAYTPREFEIACKQIFPLYGFQSYQETLLTSRGMRPDKI
jgi:hypothetical protein